MLFTLKDLHRLEMAVAQVVDQLTTRANQRLSVTLSAYNADLKGTVTKQQRAVLQDVEDARVLNTLRYAARRTIQIQNNAKIDGLLNRQNQLQGEMNVLATVFVIPTRRSALYGAETPETLEENVLETIRAKFASVLEHQSAAVAREDKITVSCVLPQQEFDTHRSQLAQLKRELETVKDQIGALNLNSTVEFGLTTAQTALLRKHNIVYGAGGQ